MGEPGGLPSMVSHKQQQQLKYLCPTKVIWLRNRIGAGEVDEDLEVETKEECEKYGRVGKCVIFEIPDGPVDEAVWTYLEFDRVEAAIKTVVDLNGKNFSGQVVKVCLIWINSGSWIWQNKFDFKN